MGKFTKEMVASYADKLLIGLTEAENKMILDEFEIIDQDMDAITSIPDINKVEPMTHALDNYQAILREDIPFDSPKIDDLLANCDKTMGREVEVPKVVG